MLRKEKYYNMGRKVFQWMLIISTVILILLIVFSFFIWLASNVVGALFFAMMGHAEIDGISIAEFFANFIGSPMFYVFVADILLLICSVIGLIAANADIRADNSGGKGMKR